MSPASKLRIVVAGYVVRGPLGGLAWHHLQYVLGLQQLGHEVLYVEDSDDYPSCYDPTVNATGIDATYGLGFADASFSMLGLSDRWAYYDAHTQRWRGRAGADAATWCANADLLLNVSGVNPIRPWLEAIPVRVLIDTDPAFTQVRNLNDPAALARARLHNRFFTFAELYGRPGCTVPADGFPWTPTRQPVVLDQWEPTPPPPGAALTTVMQWDSYQSAAHDGRTFGMKSTSFESFLDLPARSPVPLELALGSPTAPRARLTSRGWRICDPLPVTRSLRSYQRYLAASLGELAVAKHGYVTSRSGWFSERSACYLASGRPVVAQDTGFSATLPTGAGLLSFHDVDGALTAIDEVVSDPIGHGDAARSLAVEEFGSRRVLTDLLTRVFSEEVRTA